MFCRKGVFKKFTKFKAKNHCWRLFFNKVAGRPTTLLTKKLQHRCLPVNFVKFLKTPFFIQHLLWLLLKRRQNINILLTHINIYENQLSLPWNYNTKRDNTQENPLLLSLQVVYCWNCANIMRLCETFLKSPVGKKWRILFALCKQVFINLRIVFLEWNKKTKLVPAFS